MFGYISFVCELQDDNDVLPNVWYSSFFVIFSASFSILFSLYFLWAFEIFQCIVHCHRTFNYGNTVLFIAHCTVPLCFHSSFWKTSLPDYVLSVGLFHVSIFNGRCVRWWLTFWFVTYCMARLPIYGWTFQFPLLWNGVLNSFSPWHCRCHQVL